MITKIQYVGALILFIAINAYGAMDQHHVTVTTSPYLGVRSAYNAEDLIVNLSTMNEDVRLLLQRKSLERALSQQGGSFLDRSVVALSGGLEGVLNLHRASMEPSGSDLDLGRATLHVLTHISPWVTGLLTLEYDHAPAMIDGKVSTRVANARVFLKRGFFTIGNLNRSPVYVTMGQMYVPFGRYASNMLSAPLTQILGRTHVRAALLGFYKSGFYGSVYGFRGDAFVGDHKINQWGANFGYQRHRSYAMDVGAGYIHNLADAAGMQSTGGGAGSFLGFGAQDTGSNTESLMRYVPAVDVHAKLGWRAWRFTLEYLRAVRTFDRTDLSFNGLGAKPEALNVEAHYGCTLRNKPAGVAIGFSESRQALALNRPRNRVAVTGHISLWKNTITSLEYRYDRRYSATDMASGNGLAEVPGAAGHAQQWLLQMGVYF